MNLLFDLKQFLTDAFSTHRKLSKIVKSENDLFKSEEKIFEKITEFEHNAETVKELRYKNRNDILKLQNALMRVDFRVESKLSETFVIEKSTIMEWREYEKNLRKQVYDTKMIIELLKKIVDAEKEEAILDIETPFDVIKEYFERLNVLLKRRKLTRNEYSEFQEMIKDMARSYQELINVTLKYVDNESKYFSQDISLNVYFKNRGKLKQQLNGKTQALLAQIKRFEDILLSLKSKQDSEFAKALLENLAYFKKQFKELIQFCIDRIQISNRIMIEAIALQKKKFEEMNSLKTTLDGLYTEFLRQQEDFMKKQFEYLGKQASNRIKEFRNYKDSLDKDTKRLDEFIITIETEDIRLLKKESDVSSIKTRILSWNKRFAATAAMLAGMSLLGSNQLADNSSVSTLKRDYEKDYKYILASNSIGAKNVEMLRPILDSLPESFFLIDDGLRKKVLDMLVFQNNKVDSSLAILGINKRDYLKDLLLKRECLSDSILSKGQNGSKESMGAYITKVQKAIILNNPNYKNNSYLYGLIETHTPKILPSWIPIKFIKAILNVESSNELFLVSKEHASGPYQIKRETWYEFTDLDYDTFVWDPEVSLVVALKYIRYLNIFLARHDSEWSTCDINLKLYKIVAAYNCGQGAFQDAGFNIDDAPSETIIHVRKIKKFMS